MTQKFFLVPFFLLISGFQDFMISDCFVAPFFFSCRFWSVSFFRFVFGPFLFVLLEQKKILIRSGVSLPVELDHVEQPQLACHTQLVVALLPATRVGLIVRLWCAAAPPPPPPSRRAKVVGEGGTCCGAAYLP